MFRDIFSPSRMRGKLARNAYWMLAGQGGNFVLQAGYFIFLARLLGATEYGVFAGAYALVNTVTPYSALGSGMLFMRYVTADRQMARVYWGNAIAITSITTFLISALLWLFGGFLTGTHIPVMFIALTVSNCLFMQLTVLASKIFQTFERMRITALLTLSANAVRFCVLAAMIFSLHRAQAVQWAFGMLVASAIAAIIAIYLVTREIGFPKFDFALLFNRMWEGVGFSFAGTTSAVYNDIDKTMLSHFGLNRENGFYTLAYRIVDFAASPVGALDAATLPRYFQLSYTDMKAVVKLAFRSVRAAIVIGFGITIALLIVAPLFPYVVGHDFNGVVQALRWLCWIPLFRGIHSLAGSALTGSGRQTLRTIVQFAVALLNVLLNLLWIPRMGWVGAAMSSVISDGLLAVLNVGLVVAVSRALPRSHEDAEAVLQD